LELLRQVDAVVALLDFGSREAFVEAAIRRLRAYYSLTLSPLKTNKTNKEQRQIEGRWDMLTNTGLAQPRILVGVSHLVSY
jgi:hypothetical protein